MGAVVVQSMRFVFSDDIFCLNAALMLELRGIGKCLSHAVDKHLKSVWE